MKEGEPAREYARPTIGIQGRVNSRRIPLPLPLDTLRNVCHFPAVMWSPITIDAS
jgi:hypothetical protein